MEVFLSGAIMGAIGVLIHYYVKKTESKRLIITRMIVSAILISFNVVFCIAMLVMSITEQMPVMIIFAAMLLGVLIFVICRLYIDYKKYKEVRYKEIKESENKNDNNRVV